MKKKNEWDELENKIGVVLGESAARTAPPFAGISAKIAAGESYESFEEFFDGSVEPRHIAPIDSKLRFSLRAIAGAAAAVLLFFTAGGIILGAIFNGALSDSQSAKESVENAEYYDYYDENKSAAEDSGRADDNVSDSDMKDTQVQESSGSQE